MRKYGMEEILYVESNPNLPDLYLWKPMRVDKHFFQDASFVSLNMLIAVGLFGPCPVVFYTVPVDSDQAGTISLGLNRHTNYYEAFGLTSGNHIHQLQALESFYSRFINPPSRNLDLDKARWLAIKCLFPPQAREMVEARKRIDLL